MVVESVGPSFGLVDEGLAVGVSSLAGGEPSQPRKPLVSNFVVGVVVVVGKGSGLDLTAWECKSESEMKKLIREISPLIQDCIFKTKISYCKSRILREGFPVILSRSAKRSAGQPDEVLSYCPR